MNNGLRLSNFGSDLVVDASACKSILGTLQYATITRPDIAFGVNKVCQCILKSLVAFRIDWTKLWGLEDWNFSWCSARTTGIPVCSGLYQPEFRLDCIG
uniref:Uncharacterized protein n=1 Tax=Cannabis sativa TaxID=3483 RepID=A0A803PI27_CANSA